MATGPLNPGFSVPDHQGQNRGQDGDFSKSWEAGSDTSERPVLGAQGHLALFSAVLYSSCLRPSGLQSHPLPKSHLGTPAPGTFLFLFPPLSHLFFYYQVLLSLPPICLLSPPTTALQPFPGPSHRHFTPGLLQQPLSGWLASSLDSSLQPEHSS